MPVLNMRKMIFWIHLVVGIAAGVVIFLMSVTGVLLMYEKQITNWVDRDLRQAPPPGVEMLPVATMVANASAVHLKGEPLSAVILPADLEAPATVQFGRRSALFVNPYSGKVLGEGSPRIRSFFQGVTNWHRWLALSGDSRTIGKAVTDVCNIGFLFLVVSGFYLWWPKSWRWTSIKPVVLFKWGLRGKARDWNWHNVIGFWCALPLFIVVLSAVFISYPMLNEWMNRVSGEKVPLRPGAAQATRMEGQDGASRGEARPAPVQSDSWAGVDQALAHVRRQARSGWQSISVSVPRSAAGPLNLTVDYGNGRQPTRQVQLTVDRATGKVLTQKSFGDQPMSNRLRMLFRFGHTGEVAGLIGQTIAGLASAGAAVLVWTGLTLAWRHLVPWRKRRLANLPVDEMRKPSSPDTDTLAQ